MTGKHSWSHNTSTRSLGLRAQTFFMTWSFSDWFSTLFLSFQNRNPAIWGVVPRIKPLVRPSYHILSRHTKRREANEGLKGWSPCKLGLAVFIQAHESLLLAKKEQPLSSSYIVNTHSLHTAQIQTPPKIKLFRNKHLASSHMARLQVDHVKAALRWYSSGTQANGVMRTSELWGAIKYWM